MHNFAFLCRHIFFGMLPIVSTLWFSYSRSLLMLIQACSPISIRIENIHFFIIVHFTSWSKKIWFYIYQVSCEYHRPSVMILLTIINFVCFIQFSSLSSPRQLELLVSTPRIFEPSEEDPTVWWSTLNHLVNLKLPNIIVNVHSL